MDNHIRKTLGEQACKDIETELAAIVTAFDPPSVMARACGMITIASNLGLLQTFQTALYLQYANEYLRASTQTGRAA